jgi:hypothetical protein
LRRPEKARSLVKRLPGLFVTQTVNQYESAQITKGCGYGTGTTY